MLELQAKNQIEKTQAEADIATQDRKTQAEIERDDRKAKLDEQNAILKHNLEMEKLQADMVRDKEKHDQAMQAARGKAMLSSQQADDKQRANASIEVKHSANEMTGPLAEILSGFGQHLTAMHEANTRLIADALEKSAKRPKKIKGPSGKIYQLED
jgi:hypothetical protein